MCLECLVALKSKQQQQQQGLSWINTWQINEIFLTLTKNEETFLWNVKPYFLKNMQSVVIYTQQIKGQDMINGHDLCNQKIMMFIFCT